MAALQDCTFPFYIASSKKASRLAVLLQEGLPRVGGWVGRSMPLGWLCVVSAPAIPLPASACKQLMSSWAGQQCLQR